MSDLHEWLSLILRWMHAITGIMWIGQTYLFNWMEKAFEPPQDAAAKPNISGELWMVHGGGFYLVEKQKWPEVMPRTYAPDNAPGASCPTTKCCALNNCSMISTFSVGSPVIARCAL